MSLTSAQLQALKSAIFAESDASIVQARAQATRDDRVIADFYNAATSPVYWVWRTSVARADIYNSTGPSGSVWDWTTYKNQSATEQNAWVQMFMGDVANFSLVNLRAGIGKIFTGSAGANAQRDHCLAVGRRAATRIERLFTVAVVNPPANTGNNAADARGSATNPDLLTFEGAVSLDDVSSAMNLP